MKKHLLLLFLVLLLPINVMAGTCEPDKITIESIELKNLIGKAEEKEEASINGKSININLRMEDVGDTVEYKVVVKNDSENDYELNKESFDLSSEYIDYSISTEDNSNIVPAMNKKDVHLRVRYKEEVPLEELTNGKYINTNTMQVGMVSDSDKVTPPEEPETTPSPTATPKSETDPIKIPDTFANTNTVIIVLTIVIFGVAIYYFKKNKYASLALSLLGVMVFLSYKSSFALCSTSITIESNVDIESSVAMFKTGKEVNARMKQFVDSTATYETQDTTITNIVRYIGSPDANKLISENIVSAEESGKPIYMWYDSDNTTIYWYTKSYNVYYNPDSSYFFGEMRGINSISNISDISSEYTNNMSNMFYNTGYASTTFTLDLGDKFDTSNVTDMNRMFYRTGYNSTEFTLDLGDNFDTSNVTDMSYMFNRTGRKSLVFTLDLGDKFNTGKVTDMNNMFNEVGYISTVFTLDLGPNFDTSSVTNMKNMFEAAGKNSEVFTLNLGDKFDTSNVTNMALMFYLTGFENTAFTLDLGDKFDTSNVTDMRLMFYTTGHNSTVFTLDLGDKFDTSKVTNMAFLFNGLGGSNPNFTFDLGDKFDTSNVTTMHAMFTEIGFSNPSFTLDLGDKFNTSNVTDMAMMFQGAGYNNFDLIIDLGEKFDTSNVTTMQNMFKDCKYLRKIYATSSFVTDSVTNSTDMFTGSTFLMGGLGTHYNSSHTDALYAHIDGATNNPGYLTSRELIDSAIFKTGIEVNTKIKQFINPSAYYTANNTTIKKIARFTGTPSNNYLKSEYLVSPDYSSIPIYMWYDSGTATVYWYTKASSVYYNPSSNYFYSYLKAIDSISNLDDINSKYVENMTDMFANLGSNSTVFTLDLGNNFDTSNVTNMSNMFSSTGFSSTSFTLNLGNKFNTSKVTKMGGMFERTGYSSTIFTLDLGDKFDTSNVTSMNRMFKETGYNSTLFTLDLGEKFNTSNVIDMASLFHLSGYNSPIFTLDLGDKFDTGNVTSMDSMFSNVGFSSTVFTLDLGDKFDTSNVNNMSRLFVGVGYSNPSFTLDLGTKFNTSNVTNMTYMFSYVAYSNPSYTTLDLGDKFDTSKVTDMSYMFNTDRFLKTIYVPSTFVTTAVTNSTNMFSGCSNLVGGVGTTYSSSNRDGSYAHIDEGPSNPGYFTSRVYLGKN